MRTLRKYTGFVAKIHSFALIFLILFSYATPQDSKAFAQGEHDGIKIFTAPKNAQAIEGEFIVQFKTERTLKNIEKGINPKWLNKLGEDTTLDTSLSEFNIAHIRVANPAANGNWENLANILSADADINAVEPNYVRHISAMPNDPLVDQLWHLQKIEAFKAWDIPHDDSEITVAVIDTGIQLDHEDLKDVIWRNTGEIAGNGIDDDKNGHIDDITGWNFAHNNNNTTAHIYPAPMINSQGECVGHPTKRQYESHGTHVAGIIAALQNNKTGIAGVAPKIRIMPVKAMGGSCGSGGTLDILRAVLYAYRKGARIINMSLGGYMPSRIAHDVYKYISKAGVLIVAAAGNEGNNNDAQSRTYPASYPFDGIISVAATTPEDTLAEFSNYGVEQVDIAAPGLRILSTIPAGESDKAASQYRQYSGTSMAAPIVSASAAMLLAQRPRLTNMQIRAILLNSADRLPTLQGKVQNGQRLNLLRALTTKEIATQLPPKNTPQKEPFPQNKESNFGGIRIFNQQNQSNEAMKW